MSTECQICCYEIDKFTRKPVTCPYCESFTCLSCFRKFLMENGENICMLCNRQLPLLFIASVTPATFYTNYRKRRTENMFSREKSLLPQTQDAALREKQEREKMSEIRRLEETRKELRSQLNSITEKIKNIRESMSRGAREKEVVISYPFPCSIEDCRGFVNSKTWKCGICNGDTCSKCLKPKQSSRDPEHTCEEDDVKSAEFIKKDTKRCPNCPARIHKIYGCDQMYCTACNTAFSWTTGRIQSGIIHNPHYFEYQRLINGGDIPRQPGDNPCYNGLPPFQDFLRLIRANNPSNSLEQLVSNMYNSLAHIYAVILPTLRNSIRTDHTDLRVHYLLGDLSEKKWKSSLQARLKKNEKTRDNIQIFELFHGTSVEIVVDIYQNIQDNHDTRLIQLDNLTKYVNEQFINVKKEHGGVHYVIVNEDWTVKTKQ